MPPKPKFTKEEIASAALTLVKEQGVEALTAISACDAYRAKPSAERFERLLAEGA